MMIEAHRAALPARLCQWFRWLGKCDNGDWVIDIKQWRIRINFGNNDAP
jgi:hypothetical protein